MKLIYLAILVSGCGIAKGNGEKAGMVCMEQAEYDTLLLDSKKDKVKKDKSEVEEISAETEEVAAQAEVEEVAVQAEPTVTPTPDTREYVSVTVEETIGLYTSMTKNTYTATVIKEEFEKKAARYCYESTATSCKLHWGRSMINCVSVDANGYRCELARMDVNFEVSNDLKTKENHQ